jgi:methionine-rich copper-binding protein CopC
MVKERPEIDVTRNAEECRRYNFTMIIKTVQILKLRITTVLFLFAFFSMSPGVSSGHVFPLHSEPKVGATVGSSPGLARIWFDGALEPAFSTIIVQDASGKRVDKKDGHVHSSDSTLLEVGLPPLPAGTYRVIWNVVARDGHRTNGDYTFVIK